VNSHDEYELDCSAVIADVWLVLDGECDSASRARLQHHLDTCGSCLEAYGIEEKIKSLLSRKCGGERAPDTLRERLAIEIRRTVVIQQLDGDV
jgi:mycothiol system anti-sigma-R factor